MELTKEEFESRLSDARNPNKVSSDKIDYEVIKTSRDSKRIATDGIGKRGPEVPLLLKALIGTVAQNSTSKAVAKTFGVSKNSVDNYARGEINGKPHPELKEKIKVVKQSVLEKAAELALKSLNRVTDEQLDDLNAKELVGVAVMASSVHDRMSDKTIISAPGSLIVYSPKELEKEAYPVKEV